MCAHGYYMRQGEPMRSEIIFRARKSIDNRYQLCHTVAKATRRLHIASRNTQETINAVFIRIAEDSSSFETLIVPIDSYPSDPLLLWD